MRIVIQRVTEASVTIDGQLHSTIEGYWLDAYSAQKKFSAAKASVESDQASFDLVNEQFKEGLKHLAELNTAQTEVLADRNRCL